MFVIQAENVIFIVITIQPIGRAFKVITVATLKHNFALPDLK